MNHRIKISFAFILLGFFSCRDCEVSDQSGDFIVFGHFDSYCSGNECVEFFKLDPDRLLELRRDDYSIGRPFGFYNVLSFQKFEQVKDLDNFIPQELLNSPTNHIGVADVSDLGVIYFEIKNDAIHQYWELERGDFNMPLVYSNFMEKVEEKIGLIHQ